MLASPSANATEPQVRAMLLLMALGLAIAPASARACEAQTHLGYNQPVELEGTLKQGQGEHDVQGPFTYTYLALDKPICVEAPADGSDEFNASTDQPVERIQMAGEAISEALPIGRRVAVKGVLFGAHTMWHVEPVLVDAAEVLPK
jgi:hypothetical protein